MCLLLVALLGFSAIAFAPSLSLKTSTLIPVSSGCRTRQQQNSKGTVTANRWKGKSRRPHQKNDSNCFNRGKKGHRAGDCRSAKKSEESGAADDKKKGDGSGTCYIYGSEEPLAHRHCNLCKSLEHRTRDCEERGAEKGSMLAKLTVPVVPEVRTESSCLAT